MEGDEFIVFSCEMAMSFTRQATKEDWYMAMKKSSFTKFGQGPLDFLTSAFERIPNQGTSGK